MYLIKYFLTVFTFLFLGIFSDYMAFATDIKKEKRIDSNETNDEITEETDSNNNNLTKRDLAKEIRIEKDSSVMMLIPAGSFWMGLREGTTNHDAPLHNVYVDAFYMDKCEVTYSQYAKFIEETGHKKPFYWDDVRFNDPMQPVIGVDWQDAVDYAEWAGKRLPTEAEWEKAARGGLELKKFPWGDELNKTLANYHSMVNKPVASYSPNGYGLFDMAGNVWEWVSDYYGTNYYGLSPLSNPKGPETGRFRIIRGGALNTSGQSLMCGHRHSYDPRLSIYSIGFRCAKDVE